MKTFTYNLFFSLFIWGISDRLFSIYLDQRLTYTNVDTILFVGLLFFIFTFLNPENDV